MITNGGQDQIKPVRRRRTDPQLDPRYFAYEELQRLLLRLTEPEFELKTRVSTLRRRPRRTAKPL